MYKHFICWGNLFLVCEALKIFLLVGFNFWTLFCHAEYFLNFYSQPPKYTRPGKRRVVISSSQPMIKFCYWWTSWLVPSSLRAMVSLCGFLVAWDIDTWHLYSADFQVRIPHSVTNLSISLPGSFCFKHLNSSSLAPSNIVSIQRAFWKTAFGWLSDHCFTYI